MRRQERLSVEESGAIKCPCNLQSPVISPALQPPTLHQVTVQFTVSGDGLYHQPMRDPCHWHREDSSWQDPSLVSEVARAGELGHSGLELTTNHREDFTVPGEGLY